MYNRNGRKGRDECCRPSAGVPGTVFKSVEAGLLDKENRIASLDDMLPETEADFDALIHRFRNCEMGDGDGYRDRLRLLLATGLGYIIDPGDSDIEVPCAGGRIDICLCVRREVAGCYPIWQHFCQKYDAAYVLVEVKNQKRPAGVTDVTQLLGYADAGRLGRFGMLVSRNGFSRNSQERLREIAATNRHLLLPFNEDEAVQLAKLGKKDPVLSMEILRRKENALRQPSQRASI